MCFCSQLCHPEIFISGGWMKCKAFVSYFHYIKMINGILVWINTQGLREAPLHWCQWVFLHIGVLQNESLDEFHHASRFLWNKWWMKLAISFAFSVCAKANVWLTWCSDRIGLSLPCWIILCISNFVEWLLFFFSHSREVQYIVLQNIATMSIQRKVYPI